jgi:hypothetical protein
MCHALAARIIVREYSSTAWVTVQNHVARGRKLRFFQNALGTIPSPFDCYLAHRGLKTLHVRMRQHQACRVPACTCRPLIELVLIDCLSSSYLSTAYQARTYRLLIKLVLIDCLSSLYLSTAYQACIIDCFSSSYSSSTAYQARTHQPLITLGPSPQTNALAVARFLEVSPFVDGVIYPGLPSHPQHDLARRQQRGYSGMVAFYIKGNLETATYVTGRAFWLSRAVFRWECSSFAKSGIVKLIST